MAAEDYVDMDWNEEDYIYTGWNDENSDDESDDELVFPWGKYSGVKLSEVLGENPGYILWAAEKTEWGKANISDKMLEEAKYIKNGVYRYEKVIEKPLFDSSVSEGGFSISFLDDMGDDVPF